MSTKDATKQDSKRLAWLLRHGARESGLVMDEAGFADIDDVLAHAGLSRAALDVVVRDNDKDRYQIEGARIRACQGHSTEGTPVTAAGLEATWVEVHDDALVFHGTSVAAARSILCMSPTSSSDTRGGITAQARTHVHLAASADARVGKRAAVDVLLAVAPTLLRQAGLRLFRAPNGVLLVRAVPRAAIIDVRAMNRPGERALSELRAALVGEGSAH